MADAIPAASADILAAQAQSGMEGVKAYQQAQDTLSQQRQAAVQQAMQEAAMRGAPVGAMDSQLSTITTPYDQRIASLQQSQAGYSADMVSRDKRYSDYQSAVNAARSLVPGEVEKIVAPIRAQGEATVRNTERQGEQAVSQIDAQTRLALAQMQARAQAAQIAAAKDAAGKAAETKKLSGTDLEAMLSRTVNARLGQSLTSGAQLVAQNESAKSQNVAINDLGAINSPTEGVTRPAPAGPRATPVSSSSAWPVEAPPGVDLTSTKPVQPTRKTGEPVESFQARMDQYRQQLAAWNSSMSQVNRTPITAPGAGTAAALVGGSVGSLEGIGASMFPASANYQLPAAAGAAMIGGNVGAIEGIGSASLAAQQQMNAANQAAQIAARRSNVTADSVQRRGATENAALTDLTRQMQAPYQSQFGDISEDQMRWIANTDPLLATLFANSPEAVTSQNYGRLFAGEPDQYGQPSSYSMDALGLAQQLARQQLMNSGYDISDADFANATTPKMQTGESYAQYMSRVSGQVSATDKAKIDQANPNYRSDRQKIEDAQSDAKFQVWLDDQAHDKAKQDLTDDELVSEHMYYQSTHNPDGSPKLDENGYPLTLSPGERVDKANASTGRATDMTAEANETAATTDLLTFLPYLPDKSKFGSAVNVADVVRQGGTSSDGTPVFVAMVKGMQALPGGITGMSKDQFDIATTDSKGLGTLWDQLTTAQRTLLRYYFYDSSKDKKP